MRDPIERLWSQAKMNYFNKVIKKNLKILIKVNFLIFSKPRKDYLLQNNMGELDMI